MTFAGTVPHTARASFLGQEYHFSATWVALAAMTGAPVVSVFCRMARDGTYHLDFQPAFRVPADTLQRGEAARYVQACLDAIEAQLRLDPANGNEYAAWKEPEVART